MKQDDWIKALLGFDTMLTPIIIRFIYFAGISVALVGGVVGMFGDNFLSGLFLFFLGPVMVRLWCEMLIVVFGIHKNLVALRKLQESHSPGHAR